jgi:hypothetical protein
MSSTPSAPRRYKDDSTQPEGSIWVERRAAAEFRPTVDPQRLYRQYNTDAMNVAAAMRAIHHRTDVEIGADALARQIAQKPGVFYFANRGLGSQPVGTSGLAGYAYLDIPSRFHFITRIDELEITQALTTSPRHIGAVLLHGVIAQERARWVRVDGRVTITEGRSPEFFTDLGFTPHGTWGEQGAYMFGKSSEVLAQIEQDYDIMVPPEPQSA